MDNSIKKAAAGLANIMKAQMDMEYEKCPFCGSFEVDTVIVDGRKASPSECLNCGANEIHPYYDNKDNLKAYDTKDGWKRKKFDGK